MMHDDMHLDLICHVIRALKLIALTWNALNSIPRNHRELFDRLPHSIIANSNVQSSLKTHEVCTPAHNDSLDLHHQA
jgi:hypothetical protein